MRNVIIQEETLQKTGCQIRRLMSHRRDLFKTSLVHALGVVGGALLRLEPFLSASSLLFFKTVISPKTDLLARMCELQFKRWNQLLI